MGFFSDLKEDLSQAVNELVPEEERSKEGADSVTADGAGGDGMPSLEEMLAHIDEIPDVEQLMQGGVEEAPAPAAPSSPNEKMSPDAIAALFAAASASEEPAAEPVPAPAAPSSPNEKMSPDAIAALFAAASASEEPAAVPEEPMPEEIAAIPEELTAEQAVPESATEEPVSATEEPVSATGLGEDTAEVYGMEESVTEESATEVFAIEEPASTVYEPLGEVEMPVDMGQFDDVDQGQEFVMSALGEVGNLDPDEEREVKFRKGREKMSGVRRPVLSAVPSIPADFVSEEPAAAPQRDTALIMDSMQVTGDITSECSVEVRGSVTGNLDIKGKLTVSGHIVGDSTVSEFYSDGGRVDGEIVCEGAVKVGRDSVILGNITAASAVIAGAVKGDIDVRGPVILDVTAVVMGNIKFKSVQINNGAVIEGMCSQCYADVSPIGIFDQYK